MATTVTNAEFIKNMNKLEKILVGPKIRRLAAEDYCKTYAKAKPILEAVLPVLEKIPVVGTIVAAIRLLMLIADSYCRA